MHNIFSCCQDEIVHQCLTHMTFTETHSLKVLFRLQRFVCLSVVLTGCKSGLPENLQHWSSARSQYLLADISSYGVFGFICTCSSASHLFKSCNVSSKTRIFFVCVLYFCALLCVPVCNKHVNVGSYYCLDNVAVK